MLTIKSIKGNCRPTIAGRAVKAILYYMDGSTSEMALIMPMHIHLGDSVEEGNIMMREYISGLTKCFIKIHRFETIMGSIMSDGTFRAFCSPINHEVPLNKVFQEGECGKWLFPEDHPDRSKNSNEREGD